MLTLSASLGECTRDTTAPRDNNFNLLRFGAAIMVVLGHSILLSGDLDSGFAWRIGYTAVNCFFVISGFLICASLMARGGSAGFIKARLLRIFPALIVVVTATVFLLGTWLTTVAPVSYLTSPEIWSHWFRNSLLVVGDIALSLPGVFSDNPLPDQVNAPLWTLQYELIMYAGLFALYGLCGLADADRAQQLFTTGILVITIVSMTGFLLNVSGNYPRTDSLAQLVRFAAMFGAGASLYLLRDRVGLSVATFGILAIAILMASTSRPLFVSVFWMAMPYLLLCLAYLPRGPLLLFNRLGDYSYGIYIIAFPVQQTLVLFKPGTTPFLLFLYSLAVTLPLAAVSWHWIERPALSLKHNRAH